MDTVIQAFFFEEIPYLSDCFVMGIRLKIDSTGRTMTHKDIVSNHVEDSRLNHGRENINEGTTLDLMLWLRNHD